MLARAGDAGWRSSASSARTARTGCSSLPPSMSCGSWPRSRSRASRSRTSGAAWQSGELSFPLGLFMPEPAAMSSTYECLGAELQREPELLRRLSRELGLPPLPGDRIRDEDARAADADRHEARPRRRRGPLALRPSLRRRDAAARPLRAAVVRPDGARAGRDLGSTRRRAGQRRLPKGRGVRRGQRDGRALAPAPAPRARGPRLPRQRHGGVDGGAGDDARGSPSSRRRSRSSISPATPRSRRSTETRPRRSSPPRSPESSTRPPASHGGRPVKWLGDGVMFHFTDPARAIVGGLELSSRPRRDVVCRPGSASTPAR